MVWSMGDLGLAGRGAIVDLSLHGARIQLSRNLDIVVGTLVSIASSELPSLPMTARVRWVRRAMSSTQCGIEFEAGDPRWNAWLAEQIAAAQSPGSTESP